MATLGQLVEALDDPQVVIALIGALNDPEISGRLFAVARSTGRSQAELVASTVRGFLETASDDLWTQLIGIMNREEEPGLAAFRAILRKTLPPMQAATP